METAHKKLFKIDDKDLLSAEFYIFFINKYFSRLFSFEHDFQ